MLVSVDLETDEVVEPIAPHAPASTSGLKRRRKRDRFLAAIARTGAGWPATVWALIDFVIALGMFIIAHRLSPWFNPNTPMHSGYNILLVASVFAFFQVCFNYALGLYDRHNLAHLSFIIGFSLLAAVLALATTSLLLNWVGLLKIGRYVLVGTVALSTIGVICARIAAREFAQRAKIRILCVGRRECFWSLERDIRRLYRSFYHRPSYVSVNESGPHGAQKLLDAFARHQPDDIVVEDSNSSIVELLRASPSILEVGCTIHSYSSYHERLLGQVPIQSIDDRCILGNGFKTGRYHAELMKRGMDMLLAGVALVLAAPLIAAAAIAIKLTNPGPVFYRQQRVGRYGHPFWIYKLRTMRIDAEANGAVWARANDNRVTNVGKFLRRSRLDELPQMWNILLGNMSFVGPRPERPEFVEELARQIPHYKLRHLVPPGLTGWAQVRYRYGASIADAQKKLAYDLYYVRHYGPLFDFAVCLRTLLAMAKGAR